MTIRTACLRHLSFLSPDAFVSRPHRRKEACLMYFTHLFSSLVHRLCNLDTDKVDATTIWQYVAWSRESWWEQREYSMNNRRRGAPESPNGTLWHLPLVFRLIQPGTCLFIYTASAPQYLSRNTGKVVHKKVEDLLDPRRSRSRTMPPPGLQIYPRPRVTLTFDLLTPKVDRFMPLPHGPFVAIGIKILENVH